MADAIMPEQDDLDWVGHSYGSEVRNRCEELLKTNSALSEEWDIAELAWKIHARESGRRLELAFDPVSSSRLPVPRESIWKRISSLFARR